MQALPPRPSLVAHSADFLREALRRGDWKGFLPSERSLCARLRISRPTLRAALAQLEREGIIGAVENKRRPIPAAAPARRRTAQPRSIALLSPVPMRQMPPFTLCWVDALRELLAEAGYPLEVHASAACFSSRPARALQRLTQEVGAAAWVLFRSTPAQQEWFRDRHLDAVIAGTCAAGVRLPSVDLDYGAVSRHAASLLLHRGHRRIALLLREAAHGGDAETERVFREAIATRNDVTLLVLRHRETVDDVVKCVETALRRRPATNAFFVARSSHALTVVTHLLRRGYRLPQDAAVVSRDDDEFLDHAVPPVTRYAVDPVKFARHIARLVLLLARTGRTQTRPVLLMPDVRRGESV